MISWGIDAGSSGTKFIKLSVNDGRVEILESGFYEEKDAGPTLSFAPSPLHQLLDEHEIGSKDRVAMGLPGRLVISRFIRLPPVHPKRLPDIVRYEADQLIPFPLDEVEWYSHQFNNPPDVEAGIFGVRKEHLQEKLRQFEEGGFHAVHLAQGSPIALYNALHHSGAFELKEEESVLVIDIGHHDTQLIIVAKGTLWTRTIPIGGEKIIEQLVQAFKLSESKAKNLLENVSENKYARQIFQSVRETYQNLVEEIQRSIGFYSALHRNQKLENMIVVGGCSKIPGMIKFLERNLELSNTLIPGVDAQFGVAYGLALQAAGQAEISEQFFPQPPSPIVAVPAAAVRALSNIRLPQFIKGITLIEGATAVAVICLFIAIMASALDSSDQIGLGEDVTSSGRMPSEVQNQLAQSNECSCGAPLDADGACLRLIAQFGKDAVSHSTHVYALIRVDMLPDGSAKITPEYSPAYNEYSTNNPLSHRMIKQIIKEQILGSGTSP